MSQPDQIPPVSRSAAQGMARRVKSPLALAAPLALLLLVSACGSSTETPAASESSSPPATSAPSASTSEASSAGGAATVLTGLVGEEGAPDAFKISLVDSTGAPVTTLKAGDYEIKVKDLSKIHNFNLTGDGVAESTTVPEIKDVTWKVTFKAGTYTYVCDPHPRMKGSVTVT